MSTNTALDDIKARVEGHTEGPWEVRSDSHPYRGGRFVLVEPLHGPRTICELTDAHDANAELIAAAPKLLAALEAVQKLVDETPRFVCFGGETVCGSIMTDNITKAISDALA